jgi:hypothetical protein
MRSLRAPPWNRNSAAVLIANVLRKNDRNELRAQASPSQEKGIAAKGSQHGKLSSFHIVEQLLHAGRERHAPAAAIGGPALMFRAGSGSPAQGKISGRLCFEAADV